MAFVLQGSFRRCGLGSAGHGHSHGFGGHSHGHSAGHSHGHHAHNNVVNTEDEGEDVESVVRQRRVSITAYPTEELSHVKKKQNINKKLVFIIVINNNVPLLLRY